MGGEAGNKRVGTRALLEAISRWQESTQEEASQRLEALQGEESQLRGDLKELQRQLDNVVKARAETTAQLAGLGAEHERRAYDAVIEGLSSDAEVISERSVSYQQAIEARAAAAATILEQPGISGKVDEFEDFEQRREQLLATLPKSYHDVLLKQHADVRAELQPLFDALSAEMPPVSDETADITLIASLDSVDGIPEALAVILPVSFQVYSSWEQQPENLDALLAYRVVAAVSAALKKVGVPDAPVVYAPYEYGADQLAIQVWLRDSDVSGSLEEALEEAVARLGALADELRTAGLRLGLTWQPPEVIAPNMTEQED